MARSAPYNFHCGGRDDDDGDLDGDDDHDHDGGGDHGPGQSKQRGGV